MKKGILAVFLLVLGLSLGLGVASWAQPWGMKGHEGPCGHCGKWANLTPEQVGKLFDLRQKFLDDTASLRKDMMVKRAEVRALWRAENPDEQQILAKLKEINAVKAKLQEKFVPFRLAVRQILPKSEHMKKFSMEEEGADPAQIMAMDSDNSESLGL